MTREVVEGAWEGRNVPRQCVCHEVIEGVLVCGDVRDREQGPSDAHHLTKSEEHDQQMLSPLIEG